MFLNVEVDPALRLRRNSATVTRAIVLRDCSLGEEIACLLRGQGRKFQPTVQRYPGVRDRRGIHMHVLYCWNFSVSFSELAIGRHCWLPKGFLANRLRM